MDEILNYFDLGGQDFTNLTRDEKDTYYRMLDDLEKVRLTPDKLKEHIQALLHAVENEFVHTKEIDRKHVYLKARMENLLLILSFFENAEKARKQIEESLKRAKK